VGRRFGQHFLNRQSILERIADAACPGAAGPEVAGPEVAGEDGAVPGGATLAIEIGPGKGALTACLLERTQKVVAIEVDTILVHYLHQRFHAAIEAGRLIVIEGDVLRTDLAQWGPAVVAGNLPYYITSPILTHMFGPDTSRAAPAWTRAVFLVQAEVAARLAAAPGSRDYGYLSVLAQVHARVEVLFDVPRVAFKPPPKVDSAVVALEPRDALADFAIADRAAFLRFASACFRHKRKTLRNNLRAVYDPNASYDPQKVDALPEAGLRAEQIGIAQLVDIFSRLT